MPLYKINKMKLKVSKRVTMPDGSIRNQPSYYGPGDTVELGVEFVKHLGKNGAFNLTRVEIEDKKGAEVETEIKKGKGA